MCCRLMSFFVRLFVWKSQFSQHFVAIQLEHRTEVEGAAVEGVGGPLPRPCCVLYCSAQQGIFIWHFSFHCVSVGL
jgi:hypothetical protein